MSAPEPYLRPKQLSEAVLRLSGVYLTRQRIGYIRKTARMNGDHLFLDGQARASELLEWIRRHPKYVARPDQKRKLNAKKEE